VARYQERFSEKIAQASSGWVGGEAQATRKIVPIRGATSEMEDE
jgi:hypothetical protein